MLFCWNKLWPNFTTFSLSLATHKHGNWLKKAISLQTISFFIKKKCVCMKIFRERKSLQIRGLTSSIMLGNSAIFGEHRRHSENELYLSYIWVYVCGRVHICNGSPLDQWSEAGELAHHLQANSTTNTMLDIIGFVDCFWRLSGRLEQERLSVRWLSIRPARKDVNLWFHKTRFHTTRMIVSYYDTRENAAKTFFIFWIILKQKTQCYNLSAVRPSDGILCHLMNAIRMSYGTLHYETSGKSD